ncbi:MAG: 30S ribosomal protein S9 [Planctomycetes bacterium]|nr:30S ribosomal protein S9 [Planctomycetota bacterium]
MAEKKQGFWWGTGRRKTSVARVRIKEGSGKIVVNGKPFDEYFCVLKDQLHVLEPLRVTKALKSFDVFANVRGGGTTGQAGAIVMGLGRALLASNDEFEPTLRESKHLTRDSRMVERKKYGKAKARRSFQFSKR